MTATQIALPDEPRLFDAEGPLVPSGNLRRRAIVSRLIEVVASAAAFAAVAMLAVVVIGIATRGASALSLGFVTQNPVGLASGGIANYLLGTIEIVLLGALIAFPVGVLTGLYLTELAGPTSRTGRLLALALDLMQGLPTVVVGLFVYGLIVLAEHKQTGFAASVALAIVMVPLMARSSQEVLLLVPGSLREAADALGVARWRTVLGVILPNAAAGIATGAILATARAAGETAPLLIVNSLFDPNSIQLDVFGHGVPTVPMMILTSSDLALPQALARAWGAAFVLLMMILLANLAARALLAKSRARMGA